MENFVFEINKAKEIARDAGKIVLDKATSAIVSNTKRHEHDYVTEGDIASDALINARLAADFPEDGIVGEESYKDRKQGKTNRKWFFDAIDGTSNYRQFALSDKKDMRYKDFCIMIGMTINNQPILGVVYAPVTDEMFFAVEGQGCFKEQKGKLEKLIIKKEPANLVVLSGSMYKNPITMRLAEKFPKSEFLGFGCVGMAAARIAENKMDAWAGFNKTFGEWDGCAPQVILTGAGGILTDAYGKMQVYGKENPFLTSMYLQRKVGTVPFLKE